LAIDQIIACYADYWLFKAFFMLISCFLMQILDHFQQGMGGLSFATFRQGLVTKSFKCGLPIRLEGQAQ